MVYIIYEDFKNKYIETQKRYDEILREKERLFSKTQPASVDYDKERVSGGTASNPFDAYMIAKEEKHIDERLMEIRSILDDRGKLLKIKEKELRNSKALEDKIYRMRHLDRLKVYQIAKLLNYSEPQIYRILRKISKTLKDDKK